MVETKKHQRLKKYLNEMLAWVKERGRIIIIIHDNPDPDCLASAMALRQLFLVKLHKDAVITFSGMIGRSENLAMAKVLKLALTPLPIVDLSLFDVVCMLDTQPGTGNNSLAPSVPVDILVDHHPLRPASRGSRWLDVRENYGVTATILYEYLVAMEVPIGTKLATALFYAIKSETQDLGREANRPDREAYLALFPRSDKKLLFEIAHPKVPIEYFLTINKALGNSHIYGTMLISNLCSIVFPELVAEMADFLLRLEGIETVFCMGHYNNEMILSLRTSRLDTNMGGAIRTIVAGLGTAGGHGMMAGGKVENVPSDEGAVTRIVGCLTERFLQVMGHGELKPVKLIP